jgi:hypothetical protein
MTELLWIALPFVVAAGSASIAYILSQAKHEVALARHKAELAEAHAELLHQQQMIQDRVRAASAEARRQALDEFLADVRVEERRFLREGDAAGGRRHSLVVQERICFRNIPLSGWIERELDVVAEALPGPPPPPPPALERPPIVRRLLR